MVVEPVDDALAGVEEIVGPARRGIAEVLAGYTPEQREILFDYFTRAATAYRAASEEIRRATRDRRSR